MTTRQARQDVKTLTLAMQHYSKKVCKAKTHRARLYWLDRQCIVIKALEVTKQKLEGSVFMGIAI